MGAEPVWGVTALQAVEETCKSALYKRPGSRVRAPADPRGGGQGLVRITYRSEALVGVLTFRFDNGAVSTGQCPPGR